MQTIIIKKENGDLDKNFRLRNNSKSKKGRFSTVQVLPNPTVNMCATVDPNQQLSQLEGFAVHNYQLGHVLGKGAFGAVYHARNQSGDLAAVKVTLKHHIGIEEARVLLILNGLRYVPRMIWYGIEHGLFCIVMSHELTSVFSLLIAEPTKSFSRKTSQSIIYQSSLGLAEIHHRRIIHRDLKLGNLLISLPYGPINNVTVKIADFGLSKEYMNEDGHLLPDKVTFLHDKHRCASLSVMAGNAPTPRDDWIQMSFAYMSLLGFTLPKDDSICVGFKRQLASATISTLPEQCKWMCGLFETIYAIPNNYIIDHVPIFESISSVKLESDQQLSLHMVEFDGKYALL